MRQFDFSRVKEKIRNEGKNTLLVKMNDLADQKIVSAYLGFYFFVMLLKKFADNLDKRKIVSLDEFPNYLFVKLFRNKVTQHWDEYTKTMGLGRLAHLSECPISVPLIHEITISAERIKFLVNKIIETFQSYGISISKDKFPSEPGIKHFLFISKSNYHSTLYTSLSILAMKNKGKIPDSITESLFELGFPLPMANVDEYLEILAQLLEGKLKSLGSLSDKINTRKAIYHHGFLGFYKSDGDIVV